MSSTVDLGRRIELVSMDPRFHDISIGLYRRGTGYLVHSYSGRQGARERLGFVTRAMAVLGGLNESDGRLSFICGDLHHNAMRRIFRNPVSTQNRKFLKPAK
jgi:hypothetical protein